MKNSTLTKGIYTIAAIGFLLGGFSSAYAQPETRSRADHGQQREAFFESLTADQREAMESAKEYREAGDHESAKVLIEGAGIDLPGNKKHKGDKDGERGKMRDAAKAAVEVGDYEAFVQATEGSEIHTSITQEQFEGMSKVQELRELGEKDAAKELAKELDLPKTYKNKMSKEKFEESLTDEQREVLTEAKELRESGDKDGAKELLEESGIKTLKRGMLNRVRGWFKRSQ